MQLTSGQRDTEYSTNNNTAVHCTYIYTALNILLNRYLSDMYSIYMYMYMYIVQCMYCTECVTVGEPTEQKTKQFLQHPIQCQHSRARKPQQGHREDGRQREAGWGGGGTETVRVTERTNKATRMVADT